MATDQEQSGRVPHGFVELPAVPPGGPWRVHIANISAYAGGEPDRTVVVLLGNQNPLQVDLPVEEVDQRIREALDGRTPKPGTPLVW